MAFGLKSAPVSLAPTLEAALGLTAGAGVDAVAKVLQTGATTPSL